MDRIAQHAHWPIPQSQLLHIGARMTLIAAISSMQAEISKEVDNDWQTAYQQAHIHYSLTPLYHTMFHVAHVYKLAVGGTILVEPQIFHLCHLAHANALHTLEDLENNFQ